MIWNKDLKRADVGEKAHFVNCRHFGIHGLILVRFQDNSSVFNSKWNHAKAILNHTVINIIDTNYGNDVTVATITTAFYLSVQLDPNILS